MRVSVLLLCIRGVMVVPYLSGTWWVLLVEVVVERHLFSGNTKAADPVMSGSRPGGEAVV
ncbi:hypothetical protein DN585_11910 [Intrasporangium calvum]|nr:hypothetical protein DN585_11910 [Intrasporangium calvum]